MQVVDANLADLATTMQGRCCVSASFCELDSRDDLRSFPLGSSRKTYQAIRVRYLSRHEPARPSQLRDILHRSPPHEHDQQQRQQQHLYFFPCASMPLR